MALEEKCCLNEEPSIHLQIDAEQVTSSRLVSSRRHIWFLWIGFGLVGLILIAGSALAYSNRALRTSSQFWIANPSHHVRTVAFNPSLPMRGNNFRPAEHLSPRAPPQKANVFDLMPTSTVVGRASSAGSAQRMALPSARTQAAADDEQFRTVRAPLRYNVGTMPGAYPVLSLRFPELGVPEQLSDEQKLAGQHGMELNFVVDTGASVNTISAKLVADLSLKQVGYQNAGIGAAGAFGSSGTYLLGDCQLNDLPEGARFPFVTGLEASALPVQQLPGVVGVLGISFLQSFPGGVEFVWGDDAALENEGMPAVSELLRVRSGRSMHVGASMGFYNDRRFAPSMQDLREVPSRVLPRVGVLAVTMMVNGVEIPALLDTGSPVTVMNSAAATAAGIEMPAPVASNGWRDKAKAAWNIAKDMRSGEVALIRGEGLAPVVLRRIPQKALLSLGDAEIQSVRPYVGDMPGLTALPGLAAEGGPAAILGTDVLRQRKRLVLRDGKVFV